MKRKFLGVAAIVVASLFGQKAMAQQGFNVSVKGAPQFGFLTSNPSNFSANNGKKALFGVGFGVGAGYGFTNNLGVGVDVLYSLQGQKYKGTNDQTIKQQLDYLKIPVMFTYNTDPSKTVSFIGKIGPQLSILTSSKFKPDGAPEVNTKSPYKSATFGGAALAGAQFKLDRQLYLTTAVRYDLDFTKAYDNDAVLPFYPGRHNSTLGLEVGLKYSFK